ncbi:VanZ family protein [Peptoniphilus equinus]|uniref:VanZ family protein n=1 Tax=Peptoniphilus equinus TaxID=3016343 RepID=A0ABY7QTU1_9FIRM|nr:VanZ family protein [Peptoniphilus equinus]WBW50157.1 VanZ family protein [Peptoniphilus equinus]
MPLTLLYLLRALVLFVVVFCAFSIIRTRYFRHLKRGSSVRREVTMSLFYGYFIMLLIFLFMSNSTLAGPSVITHELPIAQRMNLEPFHTIRTFMAYGDIEFALINILGNVLITIPLGILLPMVYPYFKKFHRFFITLCLGVIAIELIQLIIGRTLDVDDVILNTLGGLLGYIAYQLTPRQF